MDDVLEAFHDMSDDDMVPCEIWLGEAVMKN